MIAFNRPGIDGLRRCPRFVFDLGEAEDLALYADALPKLAQGGARIPVAWVHEKLMIPQAGEGEAVFGVKAPVVPQPPAAALAALKAEPPAKVEDTADKMTGALAVNADAPLADWVGKINAMLDQASSLEEFRAMLLAGYNDLPAEQMVEVMAAALAAIELRGRAEVLAGQ